MRRTISLGAMLLALSILPLSTFGAGFKCPPRVGVIERTETAIVFIDSADHRTYHLNTADEATFHVGHRVRIVAHVTSETDNTLFVHSFRCLRPVAGKMPA